MPNRIILFLFIDFGFLLGIIVIFVILCLSCIETSLFFYPIVVNVNVIIYSFVKGREYGIRYLEEFDPFILKLIHVVLCFNLSSYFIFQ
jgi:hypothetical protein